MEPHQERVVVEKKELDVKCDALNKFINGDLFSKLEQEDQKLLKEQYDIMTKYRQILAARIDRFVITRTNK